jgi:tetratricopeptide (TPR) repeat protein
VNPKLRIQNVERIADALLYVAQDFERFGGLLMDTVVGQPMVHQGINLRGFPVTRLVDSVSTDGQTAAAYSAEQGYFDGNMAKANGDVHLILTRNATVKNIYLLSALYKRDQKADEFHSAMMARPEMTGRKLYVWGAEEIAGHLLDTVLIGDASVRKLAVYLPVLQRIWDEEAASNAPTWPDPQRIERPDIDADLTARLEENRVVVIAGMAGAGKSDAASAYAAAHEDDYAVQWWFEGREVGRIEDLRAVPLLRGGEVRNIIELLRSRSCLLVIDDAPDELSVEALSRLCGATSRVILTRRSVRAGDYVPPLMQPEIARALLERETPTSCPDEAFGTIWRTVGGHPLSLAVMNAVAASGTSWDVIADDCTVVGELGEGNQRLADRLLGHLRAGLIRELSVFEWAGRGDCDSGFLQYVLRDVGIRKLRSNGLTAADRSVVVRLHDVVYAALAAQPSWWTPERRSELDGLLAGYLEMTALKPDLRFITCAKGLKKKIEVLVRGGDKKPALLYALLSTWAPRELDPSLVGDPAVTARVWAGVLPSPLAVMTFIETIEQLYLHEREVNSLKIAKERLATRVGLFDVLGNLPGLSARQCAEIAHHRGKAYRRLGDRDAAIKVFEGVLTSPYPLNESRLQLLLLYRADHSGRPADLVGEILRAAETDEDVSFSVFLAAVEWLPRVAGARRGELVACHAAKIEKVVLAAANIGLEQAFKTFASFGRFCSQESPSLFNRILKGLPHRSLEEVTSDDERFAWGDILFEASRTPGNAQITMQEDALRWFESLVSSEVFHRQRHAELLIEIGRYADAESILRGIDSPQKPEFVERLMARARLALGDPAAALQWIDRALEHLTAVRFESEFHELRFDIRTALRDRNAADDLRLAIDRADPGERRVRLERKLKSDAA